jgi:UDP-GlcNAc:undecaprenyl-phosphate GlcNAc-1-phosphate transferase
LAGLVAAAVTFVATPLAIRIAVATDFLDRPTGYKAHAASTPYLGGAAVIVGFVVAAFAFGGGNGDLLPIVAGAVALWALGTIDDHIGLLVPPRVLGEMAACSTTSMAPRRASVR